jgi:hypothetical protein
MSLITGTISRLGLIVDQRKITETCQLSWNKEVAYLLLVTPCKRVFENTVITQLAKKFRAHYGNWRFIAMSTKSPLVPHYKRNGTITGVKLQNTAPRSHSSWNCRLKLRQIINISRNSMRSSLVFADRRAETL